MVWSHERVETLERLWLTGAKSTVIAQELGISRHAVMGRIRRMGMKGMKGAGIGTPHTRPQRTRKKPVVPGYDVTAGHISISRGSIDGITLGEASILTEVVSAVRERLDPHLLDGLEGTVKVGLFEMYVFHDDLRLHTDLALHEDDETMGLVVRATEELTLTTGKSDVVAAEGDVYLLSPTRRHGARSKGTTMFIAKDYSAGTRPNPEAFRVKAIACLKAWASARVGVEA